MDAEPVQLWEHHDVVRVQRWHHNPGDPHQQRWVAVGRLADGRWYADRYGDGPAQGLAFGGDRSEVRARETAEAWMAEVGPWVEVPAAYDSAGRPATPGPWAKVAGGWRRDEHEQPPRTREVRGGWRGNGQPA